MKKKKKSKTFVKNGSKCHKINANHSASYVDYPDLTKNRKDTINLINKKDKKCFQYVVTLVLNHKQMKEDPQRRTKIKPWEEIIFPSEKDDWKIFDKK